MVVHPVCRSARAILQGFEKKEINAILVIMKTLKQHDDYVKTIADQMRMITQDPAGKKINFVHGGTHSTRTEESKDFAFVDISDFNEVIEVNATEQYALIEPNVSLDKLLRATLEHNLIPQVIAEFPGITVGGGNQWCIA